MLHFIYTRTTRDVHSSINVVLQSSHEAYLMNANDFTERIVYLYVISLPKVTSSTISLINFGNKHKVENHRI